MQLNYLNKMMIYSFWTIGIIISLQVFNVKSSDLVTNIVNQAGYPCEQYEVKTTDDYFLTIHRIPPKNSRKRKVFILMHGIIGSAADFLLPGRNRALGTILHDEGHDVWLPNARGTTWSKKHKTLNIGSKEFWNFSFHEIGVYDLTAIIDYVLLITGADKINYICHSQGCTILFVMLSERPEYNQKIEVGYLLGPVSHLRYLSSTIVRALALQMNEIQILLERAELHGVFQSNELYHMAGTFLCGPNSVTQDLCIMLMYSGVGFSKFNIDRLLLPKIYQTTPAGISAKQIYHFCQSVQSGKFRQYDYRTTEANKKIYKKSVPPEYNLKNIAIPIHLFYASEDPLSTKKDIFSLFLPNLANVTKINLYEIRGFNHIDFLYSRNAPKFIYKKILQLIKD